MADYNINVTPDHEQQTIYVSQNDVGRQITVQLYKKDRKPYTIPTGATVKLVGTKPSGLGFTVVGTWDSSTATFETTAEMTDEAGLMLCEIRINVNDIQIGSANAILFVEVNPHPDDTTDGTAEHVINIITALVNQAEDAADRAEQSAARAGYITINVNDAGHLIYTKTSNTDLDFEIDNNGHLILEVE